MNKHLIFAEFLVDLLDNRFEILGFKFGVDPLIGLVPGLGDIASLLISFYIVYIGIKINLPGDKLAKMILNIVADFLLGLLPVVGDFGDFIFKANTRNLKILRTHKPEQIKEILEGEIVG